MTIKDLLESGLVQDDHRIRIRVEFGGVKKYFTGAWYEDKIMNLLDLEIAGFTFERGFPNDEWTLTAGKEEVV